MTAYAAFGEAAHEMGGSSRDYDRAGREEERALLAVCAYPAVGEGDRLAKARYLLPSRRAANLTCLSTCRLFFARQCGRDNADHYAAGKPPSDRPKLAG